MEADAGSLTLDGAAIAGPGPDRAMVFQNYSLLPRMNLFNNVRTAVHAARPERGRVHGATRHTSCDQNQKKCFHEVS